MEEMVLFSQSSLLLTPKFQVNPTRKMLISQIQPSLASITCMTKHAAFPSFRTLQKKSYKAHTVSVNSAAQSGGILPDSGGSNSNLGGPGGGPGGNGDEGNHDGEGGSDKSGMSMSQKLTLCFAGIVGIGGVMGYLKGRSRNSLTAGGLSAIILCFVYAILPLNPVLASSIGLGLSASLLGVMGSRFIKSRKIFPAGIVAFASFVMSGGYLHGILRGLH